MKRIFLTVNLFFAIFSLSAQEGRSFQIWNLNSVQGNITEKTGIKFSEKIHYSPRESNIDIKSADIALINRPNERFEFGTGFRISGVDQEYGWIKEQRYMVFGKIFKESEKFEYAFVNRIEYRNFDKAENHFRHKQSFTLLFPDLPM